MQWHRSHAASLLTTGLVSDDGCGTSGSFCQQRQRERPPEVALEIERTIYDVPSNNAAAAIDDAYNTYTYLCDRGKDEDAEGLFLKTAAHIVMIAGYRDEQ